ncbi:protein-disulfide reductase DsbD [Carnimonas nigrificans]|uniref:protein-disulfide reductase DsbD n=1 Tax=Carnimonas nigrificans TaxID=64323 RepID=UPI0006854673|nr:protein-disulfide reductase DsbD [Carnimonas nigrificans]
MRYLFSLLLMLATLLALPLSHADSLFQQDPLPGSAKSNPANASPSSFAGGSAQHSDFLPVDQAFKLHSWRDQDNVWIGIEIHPGYYLYRDRIHLKAADNDLTLGDPELPAGEFKSDRFMGDVSVFHQQLVFHAPIKQRNGEAPKVTLDYQGCAEKGLCYAPEHRTLTVDPGPRPALFDQPRASSATPPAASGSEAPSSSATADSAPASTSSSVSAWQLLLLFFAGAGLVLTPCVLPMLPIISALIVGQNASLKRALLLSGCYVAGMVITYAALGMVVGLIGGGLNLQAHMQSPWVVVPFALLFVLLALFTNEWIRLPNTGWGQRTAALEERYRQMGPVGLVVAGAVSTLVVSPCLSAPLAGVLTYLSTTGNALSGALSLLALGLGMGIPLMLVSVFGSRIVPRRGAWMERVRNLCALALLAVALWLVDGWLPAALVLGGNAVLMLAAALYLGAFEHKAPHLLRAVALMLAGWALCCLVGAAMGNGDPLKPLAMAAPSTAPASNEATPAQKPDFTTLSSIDQLDREIAQAAQQGRPVMVDLYADWCVACKAMEADLFTRPDVANALGKVTLIRFDVTDNSEDARRLLKRYGLYGPPTLLFFSDDKERRDLRLQGEPSAEQLIEAINKID